MKALKIALATALLGAGGAAGAQTASDAQCIVLSNAFAAQAKDEHAKKVAEAAVFFYLGRVSNSMTAAQLKALLDAQMKTLNGQNAPAIMNQCAAAIQAKVTMLESIGGQAKPAPAKPTTKPTPTR